MKNKNNIFIRFFHSRYWHADYRLFLAGVLLLIFYLLTNSSLFSHVFEVHFPSGAEMQMMKKGEKVEQQKKIEREYKKQQSKKDKKKKK